MDGRVISAKADRPRPCRRPHLLTGKGGSLIMLTAAGTEQEESGNGSLKHSGRISGRYLSLVDQGSDPNNVLGDTMEAIISYDQTNGPQR